jgi:hypothetical protein
MREGLFESFRCEFVQLGDEYQEIMVSFLSSAHLLREGLLGIPIRLGLIRKINQGFFSLGMTHYTRNLDVFIGLISYSQGNGLAIGRTTV